ncbi:hypothetical protein FACS1894189_5050 [Planctomycetales bacterium]|nr:hypothetical protein FACS1894189_5050 [Planctomycetales bacterium]
MFTRQQIYTLLIIISAALMLGRILAVNRVDLQKLQSNRLDQIEPRLKEKENRLRQTLHDKTQIHAELEKTRQNLIRDAQLELPVFSANDRSRWDTIRVLVEPEMRVHNAEGKTLWYAIDKAQNVKGWDTIDMVKHDLAEPGQAHLYSSKPPLLPTVLAIPYAVIYWGSSQKISLETEPYLVVRVVLVLCNLIPLLFCWMLLARLIERFGQTDWGRVFSATFVCFGTFLSTFVITLNNHLPAVFCITVAFYSAIRILFDNETRWRYYFTAGFFGAFAAACELPALSFCVFLGALLLWYRSRQTLLGYVPAAVIVAAAFFATNYIAHQTFIPAYGHQSWYIFEYERGGKVRDSYWKNPVGIDRGEESRRNYVFHSTVGHHGLFSLTPVYLLSFAGLGFWIFDRRYRNVALMILAMSLIVFTFWMGQAQPNRNYGGMTSALRWMFWFVPLWSVPLVTAADWFGKYRWGRCFAILLLAASVMSAAYPIWNPWTHPWIYQMLNEFSPAS